ncbi:Wzz/FepE/Etk N-terminal domain-containing protein [Methyloglobulus sp.]|uniref:Wzz/FepE/Etk N-terminal domain-containing protein n=1 Tax=Methyloglobulus sp. TaxID=2518622 RepID=UPI0032B77E54
MNNEDKKDMKSVSAPQYVYPPMMYPQGDEINLLDIWRILVKRKKLIVAICLLITLMGSAYAILKPTIYVYSTAVEIGSTSMGGKEAPVDDINNAASKLKELYVNSVLSDFYRDNPNEKKDLLIDVSVPKNSEILMIGSKCSEEEAPLYRQLINKISAKLVADHSEKIKEFRAVLFERIGNAKNRLALLEDNEKQIAQRIEGFDKAFKVSPIDNSGTTALVMTELSSQQHQISGEKFSLLAQITDKESDLKLTHDTRLLYPVEKSIEPVGLDTKMMISAFVFAGLVLGVFIALAWDFIEKMKSQLSTEN